MSNARRPMKLIHYNIVTQPNVSMMNVSAVSVNGLTGYVSFSAPALAALQIGPGEGIALIQDAERPTDWYIMVSADGFPLKARKYWNGKSIANRFGCRPVVTILLKSLNQLPFRAVLRIRMDTTPLVVEDGLKIFALATKAAIVKSPQP